MILFFLGLMASSGQSSDLRKDSLSQQVPSAGSYKLSQLYPKSKLQHEDSDEESSDSDAARGSSSGLVLDLQLLGVSPCNQSKIPAGLFWFAPLPRAPPSIS
jgi:hypothetical protein